MTQALYRGWDRAEIDRQLNLRARWPEHAEFFARWSRDSAAVRGRIEARLDLAYGRSGGQRLDLFPAAPSRSGAGAPLLAFIHGGYWQGLDKGDFSYLAPPFVASGIAFASLNYDLAPKVGVAEIVAQVREAIAWLARNARAHGVDPGRIFVAGHSAGGHLAAMALGADWTAEGADLPPGLVKGGCSVSGVYELEPLRLSYHQEVLRLDPATVATMSPMRRMPVRSGPLICAVGSEETEEFLRQQDEFVAAWRAAGLEARVVDLPGRHHFSAIDALAEPDHALFAAVRDMVLAGP
ncbi:MAG: alpha/beta hydrolase [Kiloniellaceae bacterium]